MPFFLRMPWNLWTKGPTEAWRKLTNCWNKFATLAMRNWTTNFRKWTNTILTAWRQQHWWRFWRSKFPAHVLNCVFRWSALNFEKVRLIEMCAQAQKRSLNFSSDSTSNLPWRARRSTRCGKCFSWAKTELWTTRSSCVLLSTILPPASTRTPRSNPLEWATMTSARNPEN